MADDGKIVNPDVLNSLENYNKKIFIFSGRQSRDNTYNLFKYLQKIEGEEIVGADGMKRKFKIVGRSQEVVRFSGETFKNEVNEIKKIKKKR